ncbi:MAG: ABC transporter permease [Armatimonadota bacterium]|nr:ABC transporter permease [Armatimonadota bacterium]
MTTARATPLDLPVPAVPRRAGTFVRRLFRRRLVIVGAVLLGTFLLVSAAAPLLAPQGYDDQDLLRRLRPPSADFPLGTDSLGRDLLARIVWGARVSLMVGVLAMSLGLTGGSLLGLVSGFYGGRVDRLVMGLMDVLLSFPGILLALAVVAALGPGLYQVMVAVGIQQIPAFARLVRGSVLTVRKTEYAEAARVVGASDTRIMARHIVPNVVSPVIVLASLDIGTAILSSAGLSFLGLGAQPPLPDWGGMINQGRAFLRTAWWVAVFPGLAIMLTVLGFNLFGDGLRDALDPRLRQA